MLDHLSLRVADLARSRKMYDACLALGCMAVVTIGSGPDLVAVGHEAVLAHGGRDNGPRASGRIAIRTTVPPMASIRAATMPGRSAIWRRR